MTNSSQLTSRFEKALCLAFRLHEHQVRKGNDVPYMAHLMAVSSLVLDNGGSEDQAIAALLHDAVEDQGGAATRQLILEQFGEEVAHIVDGCTDTDQTPKPAWRQRKETYLAHLRDAPAEVRLVSIADKIHNARSILIDYRSIGDSLWQRFKGGKAGTLWYYHALVDIFLTTGPQLLAEELQRVVEQIDVLVQEHGGTSRIEGL